MNKTKILSILSIFLILMTLTVVSTATAATITTGNYVQIKVATVNYDGRAIMLPTSLRSFYPSSPQYQFSVDNRLTNISKNLGIYCTVKCMKAVGYPSDIVDTVAIWSAASLTYPGYSYLDLSWKLCNGTFSVEINANQEAFINSELVRDPTLAQKIKIGTVTVEVIQEL